MEADTLRILIVCTDLFFGTKITGTCKAVGRAFAVARTLEKLGTLLEEEPAGLVIVDLNVTAVDPLAAIRMAKGKGLRVVAFLSHVQVELAAAAREAGADDVMARSGFSVRLPEIVG